MVVFTEAAGIFACFARFKPSWGILLDMLKQDKLARLIFSNSEIFDPLNLSKIEMFPLGKI